MVAYLHPEDRDEAALDGHVERRRDPSAALADEAQGRPDGLEGAGHQVEADASSGQLRDVAPRADPRQEEEIEERAGSGGGRGLLVEQPEREHSLPYPLDVDPPAVIAHADPEEPVSELGVEAQAEGFGLGRRGANARRLHPVDERVRGELQHGIEELFEHPPIDGEVIARALDAEGTTETRRLRRDGSANAREQPRHLGPTERPDVCGHP